MKIAVIGSRKIVDVDLEGLIPKEASEIISGGANGVDALAEGYAAKYGLVFTVFRPDYKRFKRGAPLKRNLQIVDEADYVAAVWDGASSGTRFPIDYAYKQGKLLLLNILYPKQ